RRVAELHDIPYRPDTRRIAPAIERGLEDIVQRLSPARLLPYPDVGCETEESATPVNRVEVVSRRKPFGSAVRRLATGHVPRELTENVALGGPSGSSAEDRLVVRS